jgi:hypothetical protein
MTNKILKPLFALIFALVNSGAFGQEQVEMADNMRSEGKIYVVVAILVLITSGLIFYVFLTDRKISRLEEKITGKKT